VTHTDDYPGDQKESKAASRDSAPGAVASTMNAGLPDDLPVRPAAKPFSQYPIHQAVYDGDVHELSRLLSKDTSQLNVLAG